MYGIFLTDFDNLYEELNSLYEDAAISSDQYALYTTGASNPRQLTDFLPSVNDCLVQLDSTKRGTGNDSLIDKVFSVYRGSSTNYSLWRDIRVVSKLRKKDGTVAYIFIPEFSPGSAIYKLVDSIISKSPDKETLLKIGGNTDIGGTKWQGLSKTETTDSGIYAIKGDSAKYQWKNVIYIGKAKDFNNRRGAHSRSENRASLIDTAISMVKADKTAIDSVFTWCRLYKVSTEDMVILEQSNVRLEDFLSTLEVKFIAKYHTYKFDKENNEYNVDYGGQGFNVTKGGEGKSGVYTVLTPAVVAKVQNELRKVADALSNNQPVESKWSIIKRLNDEDHILLSYGTIDRANTVGQKQPIVDLEQWADAVYARLGTTTGVYKLYTQIDDNPDNKKYVGTYKGKNALATAIYEDMVDQLEQAAQKDSIFKIDTNSAGDEIFYDGKQQDIAWAVRLKNQNSLMPLSYSRGSTLDQNNVFADKYKRLTITGLSQGDGPIDSALRSKPEEAYVQQNKTDQKDLANCAFKPTKYYIEKQKTKKE